MFKHSLVVLFFSIAGVAALVATQGGDPAEPVAVPVERDESPLLTHVDTPSSYDSAGLLVGLLEDELAVHVDVGNGNSLAVLGTHPPSNTRTIVALGHRIGWLQLAFPVELPGESASLASYVEEIALQADEDLLSLRIISKQRAGELLRTCHPELKAEVRPPHGSRFRNDTRLQWMPDPQRLVLDAWHTIDDAANDCVSASVDLVSEEVWCLEGAACRVY